MPQWHDYRVACSLLSRYLGNVERAGGRGQKNPGYQGRETQTVVLNLTASTDYPTFAGQISWIPPACVGFAFTRCGPVVDVRSPAKSGPHFPHAFGSAVAKSMSGRVRLASLILNQWTSPKMERTPDRQLKGSVVPTLATMALHGTGLQKSAAPCRRERMLSGGQTRKLCASKMQLSGKGQTTDRRRRLLREERSTGNSDGESPRFGDSGSRRQSKTDLMEGRAYSEAARLEVETRITDLIPSRRRILFLWLVVGWSMIAAVIGLYIARNHAIKWLPEQAMASFRLQGRGTLAGWVGSLMLAASSLVCLVIYRIRRHRTDDYRGRYRLWTWAALFCMMASFDVATAWHRLLHVGLMKLADTPLWRDGSIWWIGCFALVGLVMTIRLVLDMRRSWVGVLSLLLSVGCYAVATVLHFGLLDLADFDTNKISHAGSLLLGHWMLLYSFMVFARYVHLAATGQIEERKNTSRTKEERPKSGLLRRRKTPAAKSDDATGAPARRKTTTQKKSPPKAAEKPEVEEDYDEVELPDGYDEMDILTDPNLSKAERRRLRKQLKRQNRRAA